jgi:peroxin-7
MQTSVSTQQSIPTYPPSEALTHDWNRYRDTVIATAGVDRVIRVFDLRMLGASKGPVAAMEGHEYAVRDVKWSPHLSDILLSGSYDMTVRAWSDDSSSSSTMAGNSGLQSKSLPSFGEAKELGRMGRHTEFVTGVDWCLFGAEGWCASVGWDERLLVWDVRGVMGRY